MDTPPFGGGAGGGVTKKPGPPLRRTGPREPARVRAAGVAAAWQVLFPYSGSAIISGPIPVFTNTAPRSGQNSSIQRTPVGVAVSR